MPYDSELEIEDDDLQDQLDDKTQCHYYNMHTENIMTKQNKQETSIKKENKSK